MRVVVDTNVVASGLLSLKGPPSDIVRLIAARRVVVCHDPRILREYREVLLRPAFGFDHDRVEELLAFFDSAGHSIVAALLSQRLPDPGDEPFLEVALAARARCLVTGNIRHYPVSLRRGMAVVTPAQFLDLLREETGES